MQPGLGIAIPVWCEQLIILESKQSELLVSFSCSVKYSCSSYPGKMEVYWTDDIPLLSETPYIVRKNVVQSLPIDLVVYADSPNS